MTWICCDEEYDDRHVAALRGAELLAVAIGSRGPGAPYFGYFFAVKVEGEVTGSSAVIYCCSKVESEVGPLDHLSD